MVLALIIFSLSAVIVFYAMIGYPVTLLLLEKLIKPKTLFTNDLYEPTVTYMIVAHNEEKVMEEKLKNALEIEYPHNKIEILVASDNSTDNTNSIVNDFIVAHSERKIRLYCTKEHKGKTNAQNEAQKTVMSEILVMTDANSILKPDAIKKLVMSFAKPNIAYVCGKLVYSNSDKTLTSGSESVYWNLDLKMRDIESRIKTITAGNGAIYACKNSEYVEFRPIDCHDSSMPYYYSRHNKRAVFNPEVIAFEKAGEVDSDEFKRKVRMNRNLLYSYKAIFGVINIFKYGWFSFFYFGHRSCRYILWLAHIFAFISSVIMWCFGSLFGAFATVMQLIWILITIIQMRKGINNKLFRMFGYYGMTVAAQYVALYKSLTGQAKPTWEKAETTR